MVRLDMGFVPLLIAVLISASSFLTLHSPADSQLETVSFAVACISSLIRIPCLSLVRDETDPCSREALVPCNPDTSRQHTPLCDLRARGPSPQTHKKNNQAYQGHVASLKCDEGAWARYIVVPSSVFSSGVCCQMTRKPVAEDGLHSMEDLVAFLRRLERRKRSLT